MMEAANAIRKDGCATTGPRPTILVLMDYYLPGYKCGGPTRSIVALTEALSDEFEFRIVTSDRDCGDLKRYDGILPGCWMRVGKAHVLYVRSGNPFAVLHHMCKTPHDVLYLNSFFSRPFSMLPMWMYALGIRRAKSVVLAPRGEFSPGAVTLKGFRKRAYIAFARKLQVYRQAIWHASTELEAEDIERVMGAGVEPGSGLPRGNKGNPERGRNRGLTVLTASDMPSLSPQVAARPSRPVKSQGALQVVFFSRISRKKNLDGALKLLHGLPGQVGFDIYGPREVNDADYWDEVREIMANLSSNIRVEYHGHIKYEDVPGTLSKYHLFLLPTLGENYGHVIIEALLAGCPILISDRTPWRDLEKAGVGWDLPLEEPERFRQVLQKCIEMGPEEYGSLSARAEAYGVQRCKDPEIIARNRMLFQTALVNRE